jgi:hypothetical protein
MTLEQKLQDQEQKLLKSIENGTDWDAEDINFIIFAQHDLVEQECNIIEETYRDLQHDMESRLIAALEARDKEQTK